MLELLRTRRSIRKFLNRSLKPEIIDQLKEAVLRSPSSRNLQPWEFIFVTNRNLLQKLAEARPSGSQFLQNAALAVVICGDETRSDVWIEDCSIAATILHLTAHSLGLGSCWVQIRNRPHDQTHTAEEYIQKLLAIPSHYRVLAAIGIGYPAETKPPHSKEELNEEKIHRNTFGNK
jgi:nitroreductase